MPRRLLATAVVALALAGCGGGHSTVTRRACNPANYAMQCAAPTPSETLKALPTLHPAVAYGVDFGWKEIGPGQARQLGAHFGASYLSYDGSKNWSRALVDAYHHAGLATVVVWETSATRALADYNAGRSDALAARSQAAGLGEPSNRPIDFAVDFDTTFYGCAICNYFKGVKSVLGTRTGAYGGITTMRTLFGNHLIYHGWQTSAWSRGVWDARAAIEQYSYTNNYDRDRAIYRDYGQWPYSAPKPRPPAKPTPQQVRRWRAELRADIAQRAALHRRVVHYGCARRLRLHQHLGPRCGDWTRRLAATNADIAKLNRQLAHI